MSLPIKEISPYLWDLEERPQFQIPPFPYEELEQIFQKRFPGKKVRLTHQNKGWSEGEPWITSIKEQEVFPVFMPPVEKPLFFTITKEDLSKAVSKICTQEEASFYFLEKPVYEAFTQFFACEILKLVSQLKFSEYLSFHVSNDKSLIQNLKKEPFFVIDVGVEIDSTSLNGTIFVPASFRSSWKKKFLQNYGPIFSEDLQKKVDLDLSVEIGHVDISLNEFKKATQGDWILLDHCSFNPKDKEGFAQLKVGGEAIFRAKLKKNTLEVLEYAHLHEGEIEMPGDEEIEEFELENEDFSFDEGELEEPSEKEKVTSEPESEGSPSLLSKIPLHMIVEVAKLRMSLEDLGKLQAGALLELPVAYEEGVNLVINGKKVGKGELVKIGDKMGVRITQL